MSELTAPSPNEQYLRPDETLAAEEVFSNVYGAFAREGRNSPTERKRFIYGQEIMVAVDPASEFVQKRFEEAEKSIGPLDSRPTSPNEVAERLIEEATTEARSLYADHPTAIGTRIERAKRVVSGFIDRASEIFQDGEADGLTIKLFFDRMQGFKYGLSVGYNNLVTKADEVMPDKVASVRYAKAISGLFADSSDVVQQESGPFLHINGERYRSSASNAEERYYISPKLNGQPEEVVATWVQTLDDLGLSDELYYKVAEGLSHRYDSLIAYATSDTSSDMERAIQEFARRCQPELLSDTVIPTGAEVAKGIARAPEPNEVNTLLRYRGKETVSYNEFACALTELALRRASYDFMQQGKQPDAVTPKILSEAAKPYFVQFVKLSGIDPATMKNAA